MQTRKMLYVFPSPANFWHDADQPDSNFGLDNNFRRVFGEVKGEKTWHVFYTKRKKNTSLFETSLSLWFCMSLVVWRGHKSKFCCIQVQIGESMHV